MLVTDTVTYINGQPTYTGDVVMRCFLGNNNGLLFRIVNRKEYRWAFYNDTTNYNMTVKVCFGGLSKVEPLMHTTMHRNEWTTEFEFEVKVAPGSTEMFMEGEPDGFRISYEVERISKTKGTVRKAVVTRLPPMPVDEKLCSCSEGDEVTLDNKRQYVDLVM
jgi:hypothetical protein